MRRFVAARTAGDAAGMERWWGELVEDTFDRVALLARIETRGRLSPDELDEAIQKALIKLEHRMIHTFAGTSMGEYIESLKVLIRGVCIDVQRKAERISTRETGLHEPREGDDHPHWGDAQQYGVAEEQRRLADEEAWDAEEFRRLAGFLDWAIPQLSPKRRAVIELDRAGLSVEEIQEQLGMKRDAVYQSRCRALADLARLREDWRP